MKFCERDLKRQDYDYQKHKYGNALRDWGLAPIALKRKAIQSRKTCKEEKSMKNKDVQRKMPRKLKAVEQDTKQDIFLDSILIMITITTTITITITMKLNNTLF